MIQRAGYDLLRVALRIALQLWPLWLFWFAWNFADAFYRDTVLLGSAHIGGLSAQQMDWNQYLLWRAGPAVALLGPALLTLLALGAYRTRLFGPLVGIAGMVGMAIATALTVRPEVLRLVALLQQGYGANDVLHDVNASFLAAGLFGLGVVVSAISGLCMTPSGRWTATRAALRRTRGSWSPCGCMRRCAAWAARASWTGCAATTRPTSGCAAA